LAELQENRDAIAAARGGVHCLRVIDENNDKAIKFEVCRVARVL
jgi:hypothetical protein